MSRTTRAYARRCLQAAMEHEGILADRPARRHIRLHAPSIIALVSLGGAFSFLYWLLLTVVA